MNWIKIKDLPEFDKVVLLIKFNKETNKHECATGYLKSVDKNGSHFCSQWKYN